MERLENLLRSFYNAFKGLFMVWKYERNARIHLIAAITVLVAGLLLRLNAAELSAVVLAVLAVFMGEIFNTAIEKTLDLVEPCHNPKVGAIKDMAAGGVLVASMAAVAIGVVIFWPHVEVLWER
jgi:diacylglycerol kinase